MQKDQQVSLNQNKSKNEKKTLTKSETSIKDFTKNPLKQIWESPYGKVFLIGGISVGAIFAAGWLFRLMTWACTGYNEFNL